MTCEPRPRWLVLDRVCHGSSNTACRSRDATPTLPACRHCIVDAALCADRWTDHRVRQPNMARHARAGRQHGARRRRAACCRRDSGVPRCTPCLTNAASNAHRLLRLRVGIPGRNSIHRSPLVQRWGLRTLSWMRQMCMIHKLAGRRKALRPSVTCPSGVCALHTHVQVGKTTMDELAYSINGENVHYGTPANPAAPGRIPGGSSSGSAVRAGWCRKRADGQGKDWVVGGITVRDRPGRSKDCAVSACLRVGSVVPAAS